MSGTVLNMSLFYSATVSCIVSSDFNGLGQHNCENMAMKEKLLPSSSIERVIVILLTKWQLFTISYQSLQ